MLHDAAVGIVPASAPLAQLAQFDLVTDTGLLLARKRFAWSNPYQTVTIAIDLPEGLALIFRQKAVHPVDWTLAESLRWRLGHPSGSTPVLIRDVTAWEIHEVTNAILAAEQAVGVRPWLHLELA